MKLRSVIGGILVIVSLLALAVAAYLVWGKGRPATPPSTLPGPNTAETPLPTFTPYAPPSPTPTSEALLRVTCNAYADLSLVDARTGAEIVPGNCAEGQAMVWTGLRPGSHLLRYTSPDLGYCDECPVDLTAGDNEKQVLLPGILEIEPTPAHAAVEVDGHLYTGPTRLVYPAAQCPFTATVYVEAAGYQEDGRLLLVEAGVRHVYVLALQPLPTEVPPPRTVGPTHAPVTAAPPPPSTLTWTVEERMALVRQKLYEKVNCWRAEAGLSPLPYLAEWQALADGHARSWLTYFQQYGPNGFDDSAWRQQFQATGGDAATSGAGLVLYAPDYYSNMAPGARWETFDMCDTACRMYNYWYDRRFDLQRASGVVIGMAPWWDRDVLRAAVTIGVKW